MNRSCGDCQLCCRLLPVKDLPKPAGQRCKHQKHAKGCGIYARRPMSCRLWSCAWLDDPQTSALARPDRAHYVIDPMPDFVTIDYLDGEKLQVPVLQIWCDPKYPHAHRDPKLRAMLNLNQAPAIVRYDNKRATVIFPPSKSSDGQWHEIDHGINVAEHSRLEIAQVCGPVMTGD